MLPRLRISIYLTSCIASGCIAPSTITLPPSSFAGAAGGEFVQPLDSAEIQQESVQLRREFIQQQIASVPRGSQIGIHDDSGRRYVGTVLASGPDLLELMNCVSQEVVPGPNGQRQSKTSHVPFQSLRTSSVTHFVAISPPPPHFPASNKDIDCTEYGVAEIVTKSGHHHRWGKPPEPTDGY